MESQVINRHLVLITRTRAVHLDFSDRLSAGVLCAASFLCIISKSIELNIRNPIFENSLPLATASVTTVTGSQFARPEIQEVKTRRIRLVRGSTASLCLKTERLTVLG